MFALYLLGMISLAEILLACASGSMFLVARRRVRMIDATMATVSTTAITLAELTWDLSWTTRGGRDRTPVVRQRRFHPGSRHRPAFG